MYDLIAEIADKNRPCDEARALLRFFQRLPAAEERFYSVHDVAGVLDAIEPDWNEWLRARAAWDGDAKQANFVKVATLLKLFIIELTIELSEHSVYVQRFYAERLDIFWQQERDAFVLRLVKIASARADRLVYVALYDALAHASLLGRAVFRAAFFALPDNFTAALLLNYGYAATTAQILHVAVRDAAHKPFTKELYAALTAQGATIPYHFVDRYDIFYRLAFPPAGDI